MIDVKLEDFEKYRKRLFNYTVALLKTRGSANTLYSELEEKAKDIVQESYLVFHSHRLDVYVTEQHLLNFLRIVLYRKYQDSIKPTSKSTQYSLLKIGDIDTLNLDANYGYEYKNNDHINNFLKLLTFKQQNLLVKLLEGFSGVEIAKELNISRQAISDCLGHIKKKYKEYESTNS